MAAPLLTIVTAVLDRRVLLAEAIGSLGGVDPQVVEHIVVDGGSTDGTRELVLTRGERSRLIDAPGSGIYEAMNVGIAAARGRFVGLLNSDDLYAPGALHEVAGRLSRAVGDAVLSGYAELEDEAETGIELLMGPGDLVLTPQRLVRDTLGINARFFPVALFAQLGPFDTRYTVGADRDFMIRLARRAPPQETIDRVIYRYRRHGGSLTLAPTRATQLRAAEEHLEIFRAALAGPHPPDWDGPFKTAMAIQSAKIARFAPGRALAVLGARFAADPLFPARLAGAVMELGLRPPPHRR